MLDFEFTSLKLAEMSRDLSGLGLGARAEGDMQGSVPHELGVVLSGEISGSGSARMPGPKIIEGSANLVVVGRRIKAAIAYDLPALDLGVVRGNMLLEQGRATLQNLTASGPDGSLDVRGEIRLAPDIASSILQLTLSLAPTHEGRARLGLFLSMLPHAPEERPYHVEGLLRSPSIS
jgi:type II secretion system protein N